MIAMTDTEGLVDEDIERPRQILRQLDIPFFFTFLETDILEQKEFSRLLICQGLSHGITSTVRYEDDLFLSSVGDARHQALCRIRRIEYAGFWSTKMRQERDLGSLLLTQDIKCVPDDGKAEMLLYIPDIVERDIVINADQHLLSFEIPQAHILQHTDIFTMDY